jgi:hypothetical protein
MPRCLEPGQKFPLVLKGDQDKPEGERPTFYFRAVPARQYLEADRAAREGKGLESATDFIKGAIVGWDNMIDPESGEPIPFDKEALDTKILDADEIIELFVGFRLGREDKKKSG